MTKCPLCHERNGKRGCKINAGQLICPLCCASLRSVACEGCTHYAPSLAYQREKQITTKHMLVEVIDEVDDRCDAALRLAETGKFAQAEAILADLRRQHPDYHTVLYAIGVCHAVRGDLDQAIDYLERAVEIFPLSAFAYYNLGEAYCQKFMIEKAVSAYEKAVAIDGRDGQAGSHARKRLGELDAMVRRGEGVSLATYVKTLQTFDRGFAALRAGDYQLAIDLFTRTLKTNGKHVPSYGNMGIAYACLGNKQKALECLDIAIERDPEYEPALVNRLAIEKLAEGQALSGIDAREISYTSDFSMRNRSYIQHLLSELQEEARVLADRATKSGEH